MNCNHVNYNLHDYSSSYLSPHRLIFPPSHYISPPFRFCIWSLLLIFNDLLTFLSSLHLILHLSHISVFSLLTSYFPPSHLYFSPPPPFSASPYFSPAPPSTLYFTPPFSFQPIIYPSPFLSPALYCPLPPYFSVFNFHH